MVAKRIPPRTKQNSTKKGEAKVHIDAAELEEIKYWLALTDNINRTARYVKRAPSKVHAIYHEHRDEILQVRVSLAADLRHEFDAAIRALQGKVVDLALAISDDPKAQSSVEREGLVRALRGLCECVGLQTERRQVLAELPGTISRQEGGGKSEDEQRAADMEYVRALMQQAKEEEEES